MFGTVILLVFIIFKAAANELKAENPEVRLRYSNNGNKSYTVWKDKPLTIVIEDGYPRYVWCRSYYAQITNRPDFIPTTAFSNDGIATLCVKNVTPEMSTKWVCTVLRNYVPPGTPYPYFGKNYIAKNLIFNLHVRGAKAVMISANSRSLAYVTTNSSYYHGEASYTYEEGEELEISCKKAQDLDPKWTGHSTLRLEYYNSAGILLFQTGSRDKNPHLFRTVLKSDNNNYYLECIRATEDPRKEYRYRTTFLKKKGQLQAGADQRIMILSVNGQELTTIFNKDSSYEDYIYRYNIEGVLNVTCQKKDNTVRGKITFYFEKYAKESLQSLQSESGAVISVNISTDNLDSKTLICHNNNTDVLKPRASVLFLSDELQNGIHIQGLARNNVLYQYTNYENLWSIEYQYSVNEPLNLTCVTSYAAFQRPAFFEWEFQGKSDDSPEDKSPTNQAFRWSRKPFTKILDATHNTTKLRCFYFPYGKLETYINRSVKLIFRLKPELVAEESETISEENQIVSDESSTINSDVLMYSLSSVFAVAVCTILVIIIILYKRSSTQEWTLPTTRPDPASRYYENMLSVFTPINEREAEAMENHYEEIQ